MGVLKAKVGGTWVEIPGSTAPSAPASYPRGVVGLQTLTASYQTVAPHTALQDTGMTLTINEAAGRYYRATVTSNLWFPGGANSMSLALVRNGVVIKDFSVPTDALSPGFGHVMTFQYIWLGASRPGAVYKIQMHARTTDTAVADYGDGSVAPRQFLVEDIGGA